MTQATLQRPGHRGLTRRQRRTAFALCVLIPFAVWMLIYMLIPLVSVVMYSFTNAKMAYDDFSFKGLYQFEKLFGTKVAVTSIVNTLKAALIIIPASLILAMLTALGLNALGDRSRGLYTFVYFLPNVMSLTAVCLVWQWLYHQDYGVINAVLNGLGLQKVRFLQDKTTALASLCAIHVWTVFGYYAVLLLAAMRAIDESLYEAAKIDGANAARSFFSITLPMLRNQLLFVCVMLTTSAFMFFTPVQLLCTGGTPGNSTKVMLLYIYENGIQKGNIGYGSAMSLILMLMILFLSLLQWIANIDRDAQRMKKEMRQLRKGGARK